MSSYNVGVFVEDFMDRTECNLDFIEKYKCGWFTESDGNVQKVYEVTQLINSLFELLILPVESLKADDFKNIKITEDKIKCTARTDYNYIQDLIRKKLERQFYTDYKSDKYRNIYNVSRFIMHLRNALSHGGNKGIHFYPITMNDQYDNNNERTDIVSDIIFYDENKDDESQFCIKLKIDKLRELLPHIMNICRQLEGHRKDNRDRLAKYNETVTELENLLKKESNAR